MNRVAGRDDGEDRRRKRIGQGNAIVLTYGSTALSPDGEALKVHPEVRNLVITRKDLRNWK